MADDFASAGIRRHAGVSIPASAAKVRYAASHKLSS